MKKLFLSSLGCAKNLVDSEVMLAKLKDYTITLNPQEADVLIVNSCGFIDAAKEESIDTILELAAIKKDNALLVVTGCLSQRYKDILPKEIPEVDIWSGVGDYDKIDELIKKRKSQFSKKVFLIHNHPRVITSSTYHAYIKLSEGCNQRCSFCAIPSFKGKLQSRDIKEVVDEIKRLKDNGYRDFSLISQNSSAYLRDKGIKNGLEKLIDEIEKIDDITVRILYLYPAYTPIRLIKKILDSKNIQNYFDIPIQHISKKILKLMRRDSNTKKILKLLNEAKKGFVRTSIIVGHPGENEKDFNELKSFLNDYDFDRINVFAYSDEEGTYAYTLKNKLAPNVINKRVDEISKIVDKKIKKSLAKNLNKELICYLNGYTEDRLFFSTKPANWDIADGDILINDSLVKDLKIGEKYKVHITTLAKDQLIGTIKERV